MVEFAIAVKIPSLEGGFIDLIDSLKEIPDTYVLYEVLPGNDIVEVQVWDYTNNHPLGSIMWKIGTLTIGFTVVSPPAGIISIGDLDNITEVRTKLAEFPRYVISAYTHDESYMDRIRTIPKNAIDKIEPASLAITKSPLRNNEIKNIIKNITGYAPKEIYAFVLAYKYPGVIRVVKAFTFNIPSSPSTWYIFFDVPLQGEHMTVHANVQLQGRDINAIYDDIKEKVVIPNVKEIEMLFLRKEAEARSK